LYEDGSGIEYAVRFDGHANEGMGQIEFQAVDKVSFPLNRIGWLIDCLEKIKNETGM